MENRRSYSCCTNENIFTDRDSGYGGSRNPSHGSNDDRQSGDGDQLTTSHSAACSRPTLETSPPNNPVTRQILVRPIAKPIDEQTARHASDVIEQLSGILAEFMLTSKKRKYLSRSKRQLPAMSIRPVMLGTSIDDAKVALVIFCSDEDGAHDTIRKLLRKPYVKDLYEPKDDSMCSFDVHIFGASPSTRGNVEDGIRSIRGGVEVGIPSTESFTYTHCGMPILITTHGFSKEIAMATMGGLLQCNTSRWVDSSYQVYGLTVAHAMYPETRTDGVDDEDYEFDLSDDDSDEYDDDSPLNTSSESDDSCPTPPVQVDWGVSFEADQKQKARPATPHTYRSGSIFAQPIVYSSLDNDSGFRDWALFKFPAWEIPLKPNMLVTEGKPPALLKMRNFLLDYPTSRPVYIIAGVSGIKEATVSVGLSQVLLQPGTKFVRAYTVEHSQGAGMYKKTNQEQKLIELQTLYQGIPDPG